MPSAPKAPGSHNDTHTTTHSLTHHRELASRGSQLSGLEVSPLLQKTPLHPGVNSLSHNHGRHCPPHRGCAKATESWLKRDVGEQKGALGLTAP